MWSPRPASRSSTRPVRHSSNLRRAFQAVLLGDKAGRQEPTTGRPTNIQDNLQQNIDEKWNSRHHSRYRGVKVLLTYWADPEDSSMGADKAAAKLFDVFRRLYHFDVWVWLIPTIEHPQQFLVSTLNTFVHDHGHAGNLLIFWYGGSAKETDDGKGPVIWFGDSRWGGEVNSAIVPQILGSGAADVLTLYDCGYSLHGHTAPGSAVFEHLGASAGGIVDGFDRAGSFTRCLARILDHPEVAAYGISVPDIHRKLVNFAKRERALAAAERASEKQRGASASIYGSDGLAEPGIPVVRCSWLPGVMGPSPPSPVYCHLSTCPPRSKAEPTSIMLSHLGYPLELFDNPPGEEQDVELKIRLKRSDIDVARWTRWILDAPPEADQITARTVRR